MNSASMGLAAFAAVLGYAAGSGAGKIATSVTTSGNIQAKTGPVPGPALANILTRGSRTGRSTRSTDIADESQIPKIADRMAAATLRQGVNLLKGDS